MGAFRSVMLVLCAFSVLSIHWGLGGSHCVLGYRRVAG